MPFDPRCEFVVHVRLRKVIRFTRFITGALKRVLINVGHNFRRQAWTAAPFVDYRQHRTELRVVLYSAVPHPALEKYRYTIWWPSGFKRVSTITSQGGRPKLCLLVDLDHISIRFHSPCVSDSAILPSQVMPSHTIFRYGYEARQNKIAHKFRGQTSQVSAFVVLEEQGEAYLPVPSGAMPDPAL